MSVVSDVVLMMSVMEDDEHYGAPGALLAIQQWLKDQNKGELLRVDGYFGGPKVAQVRCLAGSFNHLAVEEFIETVLSQKWSDPENLVLVINPEEGPSWILRPSGWDTRTPKSDREEFQKGRFWRATNVT